MGHDLRFLLLLTLLLVGCAGRVSPPPVDTLEAPVEIFLLDHGRHASLVMPHREGGVARYSYGEWKWYVEGRQGVWRGVAAMLWPTRSGIGRTLHGDIDSPHSHLDRLAPEGIETIYSLQADAELVIALQQSLDTHFARARMEPVFSEDYGLYFVPYPRDYSALHQSNLVVAQWLRQLDVEVKGSPWLSNWRIEAAP